MSNRRVVVTGMGVVSPFGIGTALFGDKIFQGESAASLITQFDASGLSTRFAASAPLTDSDLDPLIENQKSLKTLSRSGKFAVIAAREAVTGAQLNPSTLNPYRFGTSLGAGGIGAEDLDNFQQRLQMSAASVELEPSVHIDPVKLLRNISERVNPLTPLRGLSNIPTAHIAINHNARGNCQTITTACTSSTQAIGEAYRQIKYGVADVMLAGGSDSMVNPNGLVMFGMVGVLSRRNGEYRTAARPFDRRRDGFMVGEGAAVFVLEELEHCRKRGATAYGELAGYASTCDAFRLTDEPPEAWGSIAAIERTLDDAGVVPAAVDYINAHGTGTPMNDRTETFAVKRALRDRARTVPVSSTKSMIGHLVAAAGAVEFAACVLALRRQLIPPTINYQEPDPECDLDYVPNHAREARLDVILSNSFGFGGQNACLLLRRIAT